MNAKSSPLGPLAGYLVGGRAKLPKRERTRLVLMEAAVGAFGERGVEPTTILDVTQRAEVAAGTFYNHFKSKEELVSAVALWIGDELSKRIEASYADIKDAAERMAIGNRRYVRLAIDMPSWVLLLLQVTAAAPDAAAQLERYPQADLRLGVKQKRFKIASERAALDMISGTITFAMRSLALGLVPSGKAGGRASYDSAVATLVLRGLGMASDEAESVATRELPAFALESGA